MGKFSRLGRTTLLLFVGSIGGKLISFLMLPFYTKWLSVDDYGTVDLLGIYVTLILSLVACCISEAIFVFPKGQSKELKKSYFTSGIFFAISNFIISAILFLLIKICFQSFSISNSFTDYTWMIYLMIIGTFFQGYVQQFARSLDYVKIYAISGVIQTVAMAGFSFLLIPSLGVIGFIYANILSLISSALFLFFSIRSYEYISIKSASIVRLKEMLKYSAPLIPNIIMWWLIGAINRPIMEHNSGMKAVGLFAVANKFPSIIAIVFSIFVNSWQMSVVEEFKKEGYSDFYNKTLQFVFFSLTLISLIIGFFSKEMLLLAADIKFIEAYKFIPILCIGVLFSSLSGMIGTNFLASKETKYFFYSSVWGAVVSLILNFLLIPIWGLWGASVAIVGAHLTMAIMRGVNSWKYVKVKNLSLYVMMLGVNIALLLMLNFCHSLLYRYIGFSVLMIMFFLINYKMLHSFKLNIFLMIKGKREK